jgi:hypothetical protein
MAQDTIFLRFADDDTDVKYHAVPIKVQSGLTIAQLQAYVDIIAPLFDDASHSEIVEIDVSVSLSIPAGMKAVPDTGAQNERGGLMSFSTALAKPYGVRIPGILHTIMGADEFAVEGGAIGALVTALTTVQTAANVRAQSDFEQNLVAALSGKRSQYKR